MKHPFLASAFVGVLTLASVDRAEAQIFNNPSRTYGVDSATGKGPRWQGLGLGVFPLNFRGSPGEKEGTVTGPDHRMTNVAPNFGMGLGWFGKRSPSPRPDPNFQFNPPVSNNASTDEPPLDGAPEVKVPEVKVPAVPEPISGPKDALVVEVRVPAENARVYVNNSLTKQTGLTRTFASPALMVDARYQYQIRAEWTANGKKQSATQTVAGKAGDRVVADFTK